MYGRASATEAETEQHQLPFVEIQEPTRGSLQEEAGQGEIGGRGFEHGSFAQVYAAVSVARKAREMRLELPFGSVRQISSWTSAPSDVGCIGGSGRRFQRTRSTSRWTSAQ